MPLDDNEKWMSGGGIRQWAKQRKRRYLEKDGLGGDGRAVIGRVMKWKRKAVTNYCRLRGGKGIGRWWNDKIGRVEGEEWPKCGEEDQTPDNIVFRCGKVRRVNDDEGRPILERVDLMEGILRGRAPSSAVCLSIHSLCAYYSACT